MRPRTGADAASTGGRSGFSMISIGPRSPISRSDAADDFDTVMTGALR
jgi:hypothetical protein